MPSLTALNEALERAAGANRRVEPGEHVFPLVARLDPRGTAAVWNIVSLIADRAPDVYNCFVGEQNLFAAVVEVAEEHNYDPEVAPGLAPPRAAVSWSELVDGLVERANARWVVGVPLANLRPTRAYVELAPDAGLSAAIEAREWGRFGGNTPEDPFAIERHLGARLSPGMRWQNGRLDQEDERLDTRRMSLLALVESGSHTMAVNRAITRARYALAVWCLQAPPASRTLWPSTADWVPRPSQEHHLTYISLTEERPIERNRAVVHHGPYELPEHEPQLALPFAAITAAQDTTHPGRLHARSLLAAAWAIMVIQRRPADLQRTDELLQLQAAVEALCDLPDHEDRPRRARWRAMNEKLGTWRELSGYSTRELQAAEKLTRDLRNIAAHGSDQVLLNLGYPAEVLRQLRDVPSRSGSELALARMSAAVPVLRHAVTHVAGELARRAVEQGFDDAWFAGLTR